MTTKQVKSDEHQLQIKRNLPSSTLEALEKEISEVLNTCHNFVDRETKLKLSQSHNGKIFDFETNSNIEKLAHDMTYILEGFKEYLTHSQSSVDAKLREKEKDFQRERRKEREARIRERREREKEPKPPELKKLAHKSDTKTGLNSKSDHQSSSVSVKECTAGKLRSSSTPFTKTIVRNKSEIDSDSSTTKNRNLESSTTVSSLARSKTPPTSSSTPPSTPKPKKVKKGKSRGKDTSEQENRSTVPPKSTSRAADVLKYTPLPPIPTIENTIRKSWNQQNPQHQQLPPLVSKNKMITAKSECPSNPVSRTWSRQGSSSSNFSYLDSARSSQIRFSGRSSEKPSTLALNTNLTRNWNLIYSASGTPYGSYVRLGSSPDQKTNSSSSSSSSVGSTTSGAGNRRKRGKRRRRRHKRGIADLAYPYSERQIDYYKDFSVDIDSRSHSPGGQRTKEMYNPLGALKEETEIAMKNRKTFTVRGHFPVIRHGLVKRGWVEKIHCTWRDNVTKELKQLMGMSIQELIDLINQPSIGNTARRVIKSKLLASHQVDFYWGYSHEAYAECSDRIKLTFINKLRWTSIAYTCKHGLSECARQAFWFQIPGVSSLNHPRSYRLAKEGDAEEFVKDFNMTAAMSLLKWVKHKSEVQRTRVMTSTGRVPLRMFDFAINECYKYIKRARHEDIDQEIKDALSYEWNEFLEYFYKIVHVGSHFKLESHVTETDMLRRANYILARLKEHWPYLDMDGELNIWILKPTNSCRGMGIHMCRTLKYVLDTVRANPNRRYIIQKYIERPLLIYNTKFDIRQWFLISSAVPITIWIYKECYLRFSTQTYNCKKLHESIHLTNNSVQCKYKNEHQDPHLPPYCMWHSNEFKGYLTEKGHPTVYNDIIYPGMKQCITAAVLMHQENMEQRRNSFELFGADFILTQDFKPWLLEINANPAIGASTPVTAKLCPKMLEDILKVMVDYENNKYVNTGNFELLYKSTLRRDTKCADEKSLILNGAPLNSDYFCRAKWTPKDRKEVDKEATKERIKNLSKNPDKIDFGLVSVTGMKQTLQSLLELLKKEKERRRNQKDTPQQQQQPALSNQPRATMIPNLPSRVERWVDRQRKLPFNH